MEKVRGRQGVSLERRAQQVSAVCIARYVVADNTCNNSTMLVHHLLLNDRLGVLGRADIHGIVKSVCLPARLELAAAMPSRTRSQLKLVAQIQQHLVARALQAQNRKQR